MNEQTLTSALNDVTAGAWAVGVSGGADSVALLRLLHSRRDLSLHVAHLDHQTRGEESDADALFVEELSSNLGIGCTIARRSVLESRVAELPANPSAKYRALRLLHFREVIEKYHLSGVILAHHADDQAETVLHRILRGSPLSGLVGMAARGRVAGVNVLRPLLRVRSAELRAYLRTLGQSFREDASNATDAYARNRLRRFLTQQPEWTPALLALADQCRRLLETVRDAAPRLNDPLATTSLAVLPRLLGRESARRWLVQSGAPLDELSGAVLDRLMQMASDAATPARQDFPGNLHLRRRRAMISRE